MKLFVFILLLGCLLTMTQKQFDGTFYVEDFLQEIRNVSCHSQDQCVVFGDFGFSLLKITDGSFYYRVEESILQTQVNDKNLYLLGDKNDLFLKYDLISGQMIENLNSYQAVQFALVEKNILLMSKSQMVFLQEETKNLTRKFTQEPKFFFVNQQEEKVYVIFEKQIEVLDQQLNLLETLDQQCDLSISRQLFYTSQNFVLDKKFDRENICSNFVQEEKLPLLVRQDSEREINLEKFYQETNENPEKVYVCQQYTFISTEFKTFYILDDNQKVLKVMENSLSQVNDMIFFEKHLQQENFDDYQNYEKLISENKILNAWRVRLGISQNKIFNFFMTMKSKLGEFINHMKNMDIQSMKEMVNSERNESSYFIGVMLTDSGKIHYYNFLEKKINQQNGKQLKPLIVKNAKTIQKLGENQFEIKNNSEKSFCFNLNFENVECQQKQVNQGQGFKIDKSTNKIQGLFKNHQLWNVQIPQNEKIYQIAQIQDNRIPSNSFILEKNFVLYKLIDINNVAILTQNTNSEKEEFYLYILNTKYGKILRKIHCLEINSKFPINLIVDDNSIFLSYTSLTLKKTEIKHVELFRRQLEKDFWPILTDNLWSDRKYLNEIDYTSEQDEFFMLEKNYGIDINIKQMLAFDSLEDLTSKDLLVISQQNQIYSIERNLLSTRRCLETEKEKAEKNLSRQNEKKIRFENYFKSQLLPPYEYELKISAFNFVSKNLILSEISKIFIQPTHYESTSNVITTGQTFVHLLHSPNKKFDKLPDTFDKFKLIALFIGLVLIWIVSAKIYTQRAKYLKFQTK